MIPEVSETPEEKLANLLNELGKKVEQVNVPAAYVIEVLAAVLMVGREKCLMAHIEPFRKMLIEQLKEGHEAPH